MSDLAHLHSPDIDALCGCGKEKAQAGAAPLTDAVYTKYIHTMSRDTRAWREPISQNVQCTHRAIPEIRRAGGWEGST